MTPLSEVEPAPRDFGRAKYYVLALLTATYALSIVDRFLLGVLLPQIKEELSLSDSLLGLLSGIAFALFYATLGIPLARVADRFGRKVVISVSLALFSVMTAVCGAAVNFLTLFLARVGVAVGEAGTTPASMSIISDLFRKEQRSLAMATFSVGANLGVLVGFVVGGYVAANFGWRQAFVILGAPGVLVALLIAATLREPPRGLADGLSEPDESEALSLVASMKLLLQQPSYRNLVLGLSMMLFVANGAVTWLPSFLDRTHGLEADEVGRMLGLAIGLAGPIGTLLLGGIVADRLSARDLRWGAWLMSLGGLVLCPAYVLVLGVPTGTLSIAAYFIPAVFGVFFHGPTSALSQAVSPVSMRATSSALMLLIGNLIGLGLGPLVVGVLSDLLEPTFGADSLRWALGTTPVATVLGAAFYYRAARTLRADIRRAEGED